MTKLMLEAIEALRHLPEDQQDDIARVVMRLAGMEGPTYVLTAEEQADLDEADREIERGEFASADELVAEYHQQVPGRQLSVEEIRRSIEEAQADGRTVPADEVFHRIEARLKIMAG